MIQLAFDATGVAALCGGIAAIIGSCAALVWAFRRDPKSGGGGGEDSRWPRLPPAE
jgi:F0F1-type ATP synthase assembly protein I